MQQPGLAGTLTLQQQALAAEEKKEPNNENVAASPVMPVVDVRPSTDVGTPQRASLS